jgi:sporulation protein YlmC with PRC-barrel domain
MKAIVFSSVTTWCLFTNLHAQETKQADKNARPADPAAKSEVKESDTSKSPQVLLHRASEVHGMKVRNTANKELGTIKDTIVDVRPGMVRYAALSYGGFLGLGDKVFAVPWDALQHRHDVSSGDSYFVLDIDEATLKRSEGFDDSKWPNFADPQFTRKIDTFYEKFRKHDANAQARNQNAEPSKNSANDASSEPLMLRGSVLIGMQVKNTAQKDLGKVNDFVMEVKAGKIRYAALSYGGFLGAGNKLFAVPWKAFAFGHDISEKEVTMMVNVDEAHLRKAKGFDDDKWPNFADPTITREIDTYYNLNGGATSTTSGAIERNRNDR